MMKKNISNKIFIFGMFMLLMAGSVMAGCPTDTCINLKGEEDCPTTSRYAIYPQNHDFEVLKGGWKYNTNIDVLNDASTYAIEDGNRFYRLDVSQEVEVVYGKKNKMVEALFFKARIHDDTKVNFKYSNYEVIVDPEQNQVTYSIKKDDEMVIETYSVSLDNEEWHEFIISNFKKDQWVVDVNILDSSGNVVLSKDIDVSEFRNVDDVDFTDEESLYYGLIDRNKAEKGFFKDSLSSSRFRVELPEGGVVDIDDLVFEHRSPVWKYDIEGEEQYEALAMVRAMHDYPLPAPDHPVIYRKVGRCGNKVYYEESFDFKTEGDFMEAIRQKMDERITANEPIDTGETIIDEPEEEERSTWDKFIDGISNFFGGLV